MKDNMKTFILLSAIPGSGKSTWSEEYRLTHKNVFVVASDQIRKEIGGAYQNFEHEKEVWDRFLNDIIKYRDSYDEVTVIADSTNVINKFRKYYPEQLSGFDKKILVIIRKDLESILEYNKKRDPGRIVPEDAIRRIWDNWEEPTQEVLDLYDEVIEVKNFFNSPNVKDEFHYQWK